MTSKHKALQVATRVVNMQPGLYGFYYRVTQPQVGQEYAASLTRAPVGKGQVDFFGKRQGAQGQLQGHDDYVVVRVTGDSGAVLIAEYFSDQAAMENRAEISIERLGGGHKETMAMPPPARSGQPAGLAANQGPAAASRPVAATGKLPESLKILRAFGDPLPIRLTGHIERRGDVSVEQDWLGQSDSHARIEGFKVEWAGQAPDDITLYYGCATEGQEQIRMLPTGSFVGTRGKAQPINSVSFDLKGNDKERYKLVGQAVFAGSGSQTIQAGKVLSGPSGKEQLVALFVTVLSKRQKAGETKAAKETQQAKAATSAWEDPSVTQVFRKPKKGKKNK